MMLDQCVGIETDLIGVHHLPEDVPIEFLMRLVIRTLHLGVNSKAHDVLLLLRALSPGPIHDAAHRSDRERNQEVEEDLEQHRC